MTAEALVPNPLAILKPQKQPRLHTLDEYLRFEARTQDKHEFYNGKIIKMAYARGPHNIISGNVIFGLNSAFEQKSKNFIVFSSDQKVYFPDLNIGVYADALTVSEKPFYWDDNSLLLVNPLLVVEVLSKSTEKYDRNGKFDKYKTLASFKEYVLIRQDKCYVETWFREKPGLWHETIVTEMDQSIYLNSVDCSIPLSKIYKNIEFA